MNLEQLLASEEDVELHVRAAEGGERLDRVLAARLGWTTRSAITRWIRAGRARVDGRPVTRAAHPVHAGQCVQIRVVKRPRDLGADTADLLAIALVHRASDFVVADKPHGLASHPAGGEIRRTLLTALALRLRDESEAGGPWLPHRLDRETAGLCVAALSHAAQVRFARAFAHGRIRRFYRARVRGSLATQGWEDLRFALREVSLRPKRVAVDAAGLAAHTRVRALGPGPGESTWVELEAVTGRQHQLRVHLAHVGHAIHGDVRYDSHARAGDVLQLVAHELWIPGELCAASETLCVRSTLELGER